MRAGPLRHFITIQRPVEVRSDSGAVITQYEDLAAGIHAAIEDVAGGERWADPQIIADVDTRIRIRWRDGITAKMRVIEVLAPGSPTQRAVYDIQSVIRADGRKVELHLFCKKRDAEGFRSGGP